MAADNGPRTASWRAALGSVRVRITAAATLVVGVALVVGAVGLVVALRRSLTADVRTALELRAADVAAVVEAGEAPGRLAVDDGEDALIQVVDADGRVVASSPNITGEPAVADLAAGDHARVKGLTIDDDQFLVVAVAADTADGPLVVLAGRTLEIVEESTGFVTGVLFGGVPLLLVVVAATAWWLVGRALAPVDAIRGEVDAISAEALHRRVPQPCGDDEIARLASTMNRMLERLEDARDRQRRFVSDASHELRSPVTTIRQHAEVALAHPDRSSLGELAGVVLEEDVRLQTLVEDLLFLARADEGAIRDRRRELIDLDDLAFEEASRLRGATGLRIDTGAVSAGRVMGDGGELRRMLRNLTDNAARHAQTTVALAVRELDGDRVVLSIDDDGPGIPEAERARIFERFVRLDESRARSAGGSGLGLSIASEVARAHGGEITVTESGLGGARFDVHLPRSEE